MIHQSRSAGVVALQLLLALLPGLVGCAQAQEFLGLSDRRPTARVVGASLQDWDLTSATLLFDVEIENPYGAPLPLVNLGYALSSRGEQFLSGQADIQGTVPAQGTRTVPVPMRVSFPELVAAARGVRPGQVVPYTADMTLAVDAPIVGRLSLPLRREGQLPVPAPPEVELARLRWEQLTLEEASAVLDLRMRNTNEFAMDLGELEYSLSLANTRVGSGGIDRAVRFTPGGENTLSVPLRFSPRDLGLALFAVLRQDRAAYEISGSADVATPFGPLSLPYRQSGQVPLSR